MCFDGLVRISQESSNLEYLADYEGTVCLPLPLILHITIPFHPSNCRCEASFDTIGDHLQIENGREFELIFYLCGIILVACVSSPSDRSPVTRKERSGTARNRQPVFATGFESLHGQKASNSPPRTFYSSKDQEHSRSPWLALISLALRLVPYIPLS